MASPVVTNKQTRTTDEGVIDGTYKMLPGTTFGIYVRTAYSGWSNLQVSSRGPWWARRCLSEVDAPSGSLLQVTQAKRCRPKQGQQRPAQLCTRARAHAGHRHA
jgi:hypothetical protein